MAIPTAQQAPPTLGKSIADIRRRFRISRTANNRQANALTVVDSPARVHDLIEPVPSPATSLAVASGPCIPGQPPTSQCCKHR
jgi:hypothetical protein